MTLSGFSFRPLVFIIPWTNKPVHNHTYRYPALTFLSFLLCTPEDRWQSQTSSCVKKWESSTREKIAIKKKKNHFKKTTASTKKCSVLRVQSFLELLTTSFLLKSCLHRIPSHSSWWRKSCSFSSFSWWGRSKYLLQFATFQTETYYAKVLQWFFVGLLLSAEVAPENHTSILMRNSEKLKDLSIGV